jgi:hypothetical protein
MKLSTSLLDNGITEWKHTPVVKKMICLSAKHQSVV